MSGKTGKRVLLILLILCALVAFAALVFLPREVTNVSPEIAEKQINRARAKLDAKGLYDEDSSWQGKKVFLICVDGLSFDLASELMGRGKMPHLEKLAREGASGKLKTLPTLISPAIWTTAATGVFPYSHGIKTYLLKTPVSGRKMPANAAHRRFPALWEIASAFGLKVTVACYWTAWPAGKVNGALVTNRTRLSLADYSQKGLKQPPDLEREKITFPPELYREIYKFAKAGEDIRAERLARYLAASPDQITEIREKKLWHLGKPIKNLKIALAKDDFRLNTALYLHKKVKPDVFIVYLKGLDRVSHHFWRYYEPEKFSNVPEKAVEVAGGVIEKYYARTDRMLGKLFALSGANDYVMVVSDHGFRAGEPEKAISGVHKRYASVYAKGPGIEPGGRVEPERLPHNISVQGCHVVDVTPTMLSWLRLPLARYFQGEPCEPLATGGGELQYVDGYPYLPVNLPEPSESGKRTDKQVREKLRSLGYLD